MNVMKYRTILTLKRLKLYNIARFFPIKWRRFQNNRVRIPQTENIKSRGRYEEIIIGNCRFLLDKTEVHDYLMLTLFRNGGMYEPAVTAFITQELGEGKTFIDIGSNNGYYTIQASKIVGSQGKVISVEPNEKAFN